MRLIRELDFLLLAATLVTVLLGVTMIYSAAFHSDSIAVQTAWDRQAPAWTVSSVDLNRLTASYRQKFQLIVKNCPLWRAAIPGGQCPDQGHGGSLLRIGEWVYIRD